MIPIKIVNKSAQVLPVYETENSAGMDLRADLSDPIELAPMERSLIGTGLYIDLPVGYEAQIRPRSGLALKHGITVLNSPGTVDADYRGEIKVVLINLGSEIYKIMPGERIAQMIVNKHEKINWQPVNVLSDTSRGDGGYGSTGK